MDKIDQHISNITQWHHDRNLIDGSTDKDQYLKYHEESGELAKSICRGECIADDVGDVLVVLINIAERNGLKINSFLHVPMLRSSDLDTKDHFLDLSSMSGKLANSLLDGDDYLLISYIGGVCFLLISIAVQNNLTIEECLDKAWIDIEHHKGTMIDGIYVKEADLALPNLA